MSCIENARNGHPCCGFFLQGGVKAISIMDFLLSTYSLVTTITLMLNESDDWERERVDKVPAYYVRLYLWIWFSSQHVSIMCLSIFLFIFAHKRNSRRCIYWIIHSSSLNIIWYINYSVYVYWLGVQDPVTSIVQMQFVGLYKIYAVWVVHSYVREILVYGGFNEALRGLTDAEVEEFEKGSPPNALNTAVDDPQYKPYNMDYEIQPADIKIDYERPLGKGAYGTVLRAKYIVDLEERIVAVKTVTSADMIYFKALLQELKIMTHIGKHENIVNLIGAITSKIKEKSLFIVVEFCPYGNLQDYIKSHRNLFLNQVQDDVIWPDSVPGSMYANLVDDPNVLRTTDIIRWCLEIAEGMEYLAKKRVIHGDLAARNVLLTYGKKSKITDFGLSRQLYSDANYVKKQNAPLPWRWMAIESLRDLSFSTDSDVWSYGVTLWELFTLSETPYPGLAWTTDFVHQLENGLRMSQPGYCTKSIYNVILECWQKEPENRPKFREVIVFFENLLTTVVQNGDKGHVPVSNSEYRNV